MANSFYAITQSTPLATLLAAITGNGITVIPGSGSLVGDPRAFGLCLQPATGSDNISFLDKNSVTPNGLNDPQLGPTVVAISTGQVLTAKGPNANNGSSGTNFHLPGDAALAALLGTTLANTFDAAILTFQFTCTGTRIHMGYLFASEEYNEFVKSAFTDAMAIWLDGTNIAWVPGTSPQQLISINTVNRGKPLGTPPFQNPQFYTSNDIGPGPAPIIFSQEDGWVGLNPAGGRLAVTATVVPGQVYTLRIGICDVADGNLDSIMFVGALTGCGVPGIGYPTVLPGTFGGTDPVGTPGDPPGGSPPSAMGCLDSHTVPPWSGGPPGPPGIPGNPTTLPVPPSTCP